MSESDKAGADKPPAQAPARGNFIERLRNPDPKRIRFHAAKTPFLWVWLLMFSIAAWQIATNAFGLSSLTQHYSQDIAGLALVGPLYSTEGRDQVSVALIEDQTLANLHMTWPWAYADHARALDAILAYRPRAVVVDLLFADPRDDPTLSQLLSVIERYKRAQIPLYFVGAPDLAPQPPVRTEIATSSARIVDATILLERGVARQYPSTGVCLDDRIPGTKTGAGECPSLALRVYEDVFQKGARPERERDSHIEIVWGVRANPINSKWMRVANDEGVVGPCPKDTSLIWRVYLAVTDVSALRSRCPYTGVIPTEALMMGVEDNDVRTLTEDRIVLYGASLEGSADKSFTPSNGLLAGVFVHAMALDNLISFDGRAKRDTVTLNGTTYSSNFVQIFTVGLILLIFTALHIKDMRRNASADPDAPAPAATGDKRRVQVRGALRRLAWYSFALAVIIGAGITLYSFFGLSIGNWIQMVFLAGLLFELLMSAFLGKAWGYVRQAISG